MAKRKNDEFTFGDSTEEMFPLDDDIFSSKKVSPPKGVKGYLTNVAKSVGRGGIKLGKMFLPETSEVIDQLKPEMDGSNVKDTLRRAKTVAKGKIRQATDITIDTAKEFGKSVKQDFKSGTFFKDSEMSMDGFDFDMGDDFGDLDESDVEASTKGARISAKSTMKASKQTSRAVLAGAQHTSTAVVSTAQAQLRHNKILFAQQMAIDEERHKNKMYLMKNLALNVAKIVKQNNVSLKAQMEYSVKSLALTQDLSAMIKEIRNSQWALTATNQENDNTDVLSNRGKVFENGRFNKSAYVKYLKDKVGGSMLGSGASMLGMAKGMGMTPASMLKDMVSDSILGFLGNNLVSGDLKKALAGFDGFSKNGLSALNGKLANIAKNGAGFKNDKLNMLFQKVADFAHVDDRLIQGTNKFAMGKHDQVHAFDNQAHKTLVSVIPGFLSKIAAGVSGKEEEIYDFKSDRFRTVGSLRKEMKDEIESVYEFSEGFNNSRDSINSKLINKRDRYIAEADPHFGGNARKILTHKKITECTDIIMKNMADTGILYDANTLESIIDGTDSNLISQLVKGLKLDDDGQKKFVLDTFVVRLKEMRDEEPQQYMNLMNSISKMKTDLSERYKMMEDESGTSGSISAYNAIIGDEKRNTEIDMIKSQLAKKNLPASVRKGYLNKLSQLNRSSGYTGFLNEQDDSDATTSFNMRKLKDTSTPGLLKNIYDVLVNGIIVYPQKGQVPDEIQQRRKDLSSLNELEKQEYQNKLDNEKLRDEEAKTNAMDIAKQQEELRKYRKQNMMGSLLGENEWFQGMLDKIDPNKKRNVFSDKLARGVGSVNELIQNKVYGTSFENGKYKDDLNNIGEYIGSKTGKIRTRFMKTVNKFISKDKRDELMDTISRKGMRGVIDFAKENISDPKKRDEFLAAVTKNMKSKTDVEDIIETVEQSTGFRASDNLVDDMYNDTKSGTLKEIQNNITSDKIKASTSDIVNSVIDAVENPTEAVGKLKGKAKRAANKAAKLLKKKGGVEESTDSEESMNSEEPQSFIKKTFGGMFGFGKHKEGSAADQEADQEKAERKEDRMLSKKNNQIITKILMKMGKDGIRISNRGLDDLSKMLVSIQAGGNGFLGASSNDDSFLGDIADSTSGNFFSNMFNKNKTGAAAADVATSGKKGIFSKIFGKIGKGAVAVGGGALSLGASVIGGIGSKVGGGVGKFLTGAGNVLSKGASKLNGTKVAGDIVDAAADAKKGPFKKIIDLIKKTLGKFFKNPKTMKMMGKEGAKKSTSLISKLLASITRHIPKIGTRLSAWFGANSISLGTVALVTGIGGLASGLANVRNYFGLGKGINPTFGMRATAALVGGLDGLLMGIPGLLAGLMGKPSLAAWIYELFGNAADKMAMALYNQYNSMRAKIYGVKSEALVAMETRKNTSKLGRGILDTITFGLADSNDRADMKALGFKELKVYKYWKEHKYEPLEKLRDEIAEKYGGKKVVDKMYSTDVGEDGTDEVSEEDMQGQELQTTFRKEFLNAARDWVIKNGLSWLQAGTTLEQLEKEKGEQKSNLEKAGGAIKKGALATGAVVAASWKNGKAMWKDVGSKIGNTVGKVSTAFKATALGGLIYGTTGVNGINESDSDFVKSIKVAFTKILDTTTFKKLECYDKLKKFVDKMIGALAKPDIEEAVKTQVGKNAPIPMIAIPMAITSFKLGAKKAESLFNVKKPSKAMKIVAQIREGLNAGMKNIPETICSKAFGESFVVALFNAVGSSEEIASLSRQKTYNNKRAKIYGVDTTALLKYEEKYNGNFLDNIGAVLSNINLFGAANADSKLLGFKDKEVYKKWKEKKFEPLDNIRKKIAMELDKDFKDIESINFEDAELQKLYFSEVLKAQDKYVKDHGLSYLKSTMTEAEMLTKEGEMRTSGKDENGNPINPENLETEKKGLWNSVKSFFGFDKSDESAELDDKYSDYKKQISEMLKKDFKFSEKSSTYIAEGSTSVNKWQNDIDYHPTSSSSSNTGTMNMPSAVATVDGYEATDPGKGTTTTNPMDPSYGPGEHGSSEAPTRLQRYIDENHPERSNESRVAPSQTSGSGRAYNGPMNRLLNDKNDDMSEILAKIELIHSEMMRHNNIAENYYNSSLQLLGSINSNTYKSSRTPRNNETNSLANLLATL